MNRPCSTTPTVALIAAPISAGSPSGGSALDQAEVGADLVGTVESQVEAQGSVELDRLDPGLTSQLSRPVRGESRAQRGAGWPALADQFDQRPYGPAGPEADRHTRLDPLESRRRSREPRGIGNLAHRAEDVRIVARCPRTRSPIP